MLRFNWNRSWAFVLTLCLFTVCSLLFTFHAPSVARAGTTNAYLPSEDQLIPPSPSAGDPDVPMGPGDGKVGKTTARGGAGSQVLRQNGVRPAGDGSAPISVAMSRLRLVVLGLRSLYLRF